MDVFILLFSCPVPLSSPAIALAIIIVRGGEVRKNEGGHGILISAGRGAYAHQVCGWESPTPVFCSLYLWYHRGLIPPDRIWPSFHLARYFPVERESINSWDAGYTCGVRFHACENGFGPFGISDVGRDSELTKTKFDSNFMRGVNNN